MKPITGQAPIMQNRSPVPKVMAHTAAISTVKPFGPSERCGVSTALKRVRSCEAA